MKRAYRMSSGYIVGSGIASVIVLTMNFSWKMAGILTLVHLSIWSVLALLTYKINR